MSGSELRIQGGFGAPKFLRQVVQPSAPRARPRPYHRAVASTSEILMVEMDAAFENLSRVLRDVSDAEFFWEPVPDPWTVYLDQDGTWTYQYEMPDPVPSPFTTIGWRLVHLALCKVIYHEWAFGPREETFMTIETPGDAARAVEVLQRVHRRLRSDLASLREADLDHEVLTNWGQRWPAWRIFTTMAAHDRQHGGEIGVLRDLYRTTPRA